MTDARGCPDYSHWDYAKEARDGREYHRNRGAADRAAGKEPNHYLYHTASPDYYIAAGYRDGYDNASASQVAEAA